MLPERPESLASLGGHLCGLAWHGYASVESPLREWLQFLGVGRVEAGRLHATEHWITSGLSAHSPRELVRRVAFRDPAYRLHLDFILVRVLSRMARDGRTAKIGEYLTTKLSHLAMRLAWLFSLVPDPRSDVYWSDLENKWLDPALQVRFKAWDAELFGDILGGAEQLFPLLLDIYGPSGDLPVHLSAAGLRLDARHLAVLAALIHAAGDREAIAINDEDFVVAQELAAQFHLPVRVWGKTAETRACAVLVASVHLSATIPVETHRPQVPAPISLPDTLRSSAQLGDDVAAAGSSLRAAALGGLRTGAFPGADPHSAGLAERLRFGPAATKAQFGWTFDHPLFGLILQFFLIEAFGRELQDDCINVLYIGSSENPESVDVYFRPESREKRFVRLGQFEDIMVALSDELNIFTVPLPIVSGGTTPWTGALLLLLQGRQLLPRAGEYTISGELFDILHSRDFMKDVLREGNPIRDRIVAILKRLYARQARQQEPNPTLVDEPSR